MTISTAIDILEIEEYELTGTNEENRLAITIGRTRLEE